MIHTSEQDVYRVARGLHIGRIHALSWQTPEAGFLFPGESHPMPELTYVEKGTLHSVAQGRDLLLRPGELALYGPDQWHMQYADVGEMPRYVTLRFDLEGLDLSPVLNRKLTLCPRGEALLEQLLQEAVYGDAYSGDMILAQLSMLLLLLLRQAGEAAVLSGEHEILCRAQQYVAGHVREKLSVPVVAGQVDVSPSYLTALFQKNLHISPGEYIRRVKLQESKEMIRENALNFTEIAQALEYSTVHHFSRQFKEKFGITPSEYARSVR